MIQTVYKGIEIEMETEKTLVKRPEKRIEVSSALPSAADLDLDAEEKANAIATNDGMQEVSHHECA